MAEASELTNDCECGRPECAACAESAAVMKLVREDFAYAARQARVPTPEIVWWRAQMRAREEAARAAARPILITQALAVAALVGFVISIAGTLTLPALRWEALIPMPFSMPLLPIGSVLLCWLVIAPLALYFADR